MEEIEISSWITLDAIQKASKVVETVGNLQTGHSKSTFCIIEDDYIELYYSDVASNFLRRYEDRNEFDIALEKRKEEEGEAPYSENQEYEDTFEDEEEKNNLDFNDDSDKF